MKIAAIVCTYNRYDVLPKAIESLKKQTLDSKDYEIVVVDNSPDFEKSEEFGVQYQDVKNLTYLIEKTPGLSNARNVGAEFTSAKYVSYMDDDAIADPDWLEKIVDAFEEFGEDCKVVGGRVDPMWSKPRPGWLGKDLEGYVSIVNWGGATRVATKEEWFAGTNISFEREYLVSIGGFSTNLGRKGSGSTLLSNEETMLLEHIDSEGWKMVYAPNACVDHLVEEKRLSRQWFRKRVAWQAASDFLMKADECIAQCETHWEDIKHYAANVPPKHRSLRGMMYETDDAGMFHWQLSAIYGWTILNLAGYEGIAD